MPLVKLIEHNGADALQKRVLLQTANQHTLCHCNEPCVRTRSLVEAHVPAHLLAHLPALFFADASSGSTSGYSTRLHEPDLPLDAVEQGWWQSRGLARSGRRLQHHHARAIERIE